MSTAKTTIRWNVSEDTIKSAGSNFSEFLRQQKSSLQSILSSSNASRPVHVTIGNEAADADSIVSSLVHAYLKQHSDESALYVPVVSIPRDEFVLRCDVNALFERLHLDATAVMFVDEFPWTHALFQASPQPLRLSLLDHNALTPKKMSSSGEKLNVRVLEILDHHADLGQHLDAPVRDIAFEGTQALVGSSCTLVAENLFKNEALKQKPTIHALLSTMLLAVIAVDTINFSPSAKKVTPRDIAAAATLQTTAFASKEALFEWLHAEKFNLEHWGNFSLLNCLQCDYKEFVLSTGTKYGVSAILIPLDQFVLKAGSESEALEKALRVYCEHNKLAFLVVMSMVMPADGVPRRQVLFYEPEACPKQHVRHCIHHFEQGGMLQLAPLALPVEHTCVRAFAQGNTAASRKQVVPLIQQAFEAGTTKL
ncbi:TPA: hypothetical protein N0F65_009618 [Lagenidium giganteum]|uniref:DHHA2 domain-containing protein n=1 Tax=Lagenidium giganteum TaxID=4803 RepID=A0AAV2YWC7_9STRA|nr:TPA: hypothetical protein N0F65_009618 [Lagenidium giganteum]